MPKVITRGLNKEKWVCWRGES